MNPCLADLHRMLAAASPVAMVSVIEARGSTPREAGARLLVSAAEVRGTIGGGRLEYEATRLARDALTQGTVASVASFSLGARLGQCCGGHVRLGVQIFGAGDAGLEALDPDRHRLEISLVTAVTGGETAPAQPQRWVLPASTARGMPPAGMPAAVYREARSLNRMQDQDDARLIEADGRQFLLDCFRPLSFDVRVFGAGHVGRALIQVLGTLPCAVTWVDARREQFPDALPDNVTACLSDPPEYLVDDAPPAAHYLVMTHSHPLDLRLCARILSRGDAAYCGLIGSRSKRARFVRRLKRMGVSDGQLQRLVCPVGDTGIHSKHPGAIAVSIAAELLARRDRLGRSGGLTAGLARR